MSFWRLAGRLPRATSREEIRAHSIDGWNPWADNILGVETVRIVVPDPTGLNCCRHISVNVVERAGAIARYAAYFDDDGNTWLYLPAEEGTAGALDVSPAKYEGHWRASNSEASDLPWPIEDVNWQDRSHFLTMMTEVEGDAETISYRGISLCRLCRCQNGHRAYQLDIWEWPAGFRHYIEEHGVRPSKDFEAFIRKHKKPGASPA